MDSMTITLTQLGGILCIVVGAALPVYLYRIGYGRWFWQHY
jgi:hypothetical protein